jgi:hypothetical protein
MRNGTVNECEITSSENRSARRKSVPMQLILPRSLHYPKWDSIWTAAMKIHVRWGANFEHETSSMRSSRVNQSYATFGKGSKHVQLVPLVSQTISFRSVTTNVQDLRATALRT